MWSKPCCLFFLFPNRSIVGSNNNGCKNRSISNDSQTQSVTNWIYFKWYLDWLNTARGKKATKIFRWKDRPHTWALNTELTKQLLKRILKTRIEVSQIEPFIYCCLFLAAKENKCDIGLKDSALEIFKLTSCIRILNT